MTPTVTSVSAGANDFAYQATVLMGTDVASCDSVTLVYVQE